MKTQPSVGVVALASMLALGMLALPVPAVAGAAPGQGQSDKKDKEKAAKSDKHPNDPAVVIVINPDDHRRVVREYYSRESLPPGLAKKESLPPGLQKQLKEKGTLPPGLQKHMVAVPPALGTRLPPLPPYYIRYFVGRDLIVVDTKSNLLVSIIKEILE
jgi:hypothetical protein